MSIYPPPSTIALESCAEKDPHSDTPMLQLSGHQETSNANVVCFKMLIKTTL